MFSYEESMVNFERRKKLLIFERIFSDKLYGNEGKKNTRKSLVIFWYKNSIFEYMNCKYGILVILLICGSVFAQNSKYDKWKMPGFFRGYNVLPNGLKTPEDFIALKNYGGNIVHIQTKGFMAEDPPYGIVQNNIQKVDQMVEYSRQAGLYYVIAVRSGPGAYDTYEETEGYTGESRVWNSGNITEQQLYAEMLKMMIERYAGDTLFVGINLMVEPRPKVRYIPANNSELYKYFLENVFHIYMGEVYSFWINEIRGVNSEIPLIIGNFAYTTPELFPGYEVSDPYIIYDTHLYMPKEYTNADIAFSLVYPGVYWNITYLSQQLYDLAFMRQTVLSRVRGFQEATGKPILMGEFGIKREQFSAGNYVMDVLNICRDYGWHFAYWEWRPGTENAPWEMERFNYEQTDPGKELSPWYIVLSRFHAPPWPNQLEPKNGSSTTSSPEFVWDSLTRFTVYDIEVMEGIRVIGSASDLSQASWTYSGEQLEEGKTYRWHVRAKNPGGTPENASAWSELWSFTVEGNSRKGQVATKDAPPKQFKLYDNYPNPFNPVTVIGYQLSVNGLVSLKVYDLIGREIKTLVERWENAGYHHVEFDASSLPSGIYIYRLSTCDYVEMKRMALVK